MIEIRKNDYAQPTVIRENIVKMMCDYIIEYIEDDCYGYWIKTWQPDKLYIETDAKQQKCLDIINKKEDGKKTYIRVYGSELRKVFELLDINGWNLGNKDNDGGVTITKAPIYKKVHWDEIKFFIDL